MTPHGVSWWPRMVRFVVGLPSGASNLDFHDQDAADHFQNQCSSGVKRLVPCHRRGRLILVRPADVNYIQLVTTRSGGSDA